MGSFLLRIVVIRNALLTLVAGQEVFDSPVRLMHITDSHISLANEAPPRSSRMHAAFSRSRNRETNAFTTPAQEFSRLVNLARDWNVDLVVLGGDILNFPSNRTMMWVLEQLRLTGKDFIFTSGNHDWLLEGQRGAARYDADRVSELSSTFRPFYEQSVSSVSSCYNNLGYWDRPGIGILYGCAVVKGLLLLFVDNSNFQVDSDQLEFVRVQLSNVAANVPVVVLLHIPLMLPGMKLPPKELCGHQHWGAATDVLWQVEDRPRWPSGNLQSTLDFRELIQAHAAPGPIVALLSGHTHEDAAVALSPEERCANGTWTVRSEGGRERVEASGALQYTTHTAAEGAYRLLTIY
ncbi:unnamed protein product [Effrenium voratum]|uniref:Calcineurin-like phosphoesterase domain-containing protein n=1 Tax=Effrenium voratum TaxID=2562239 RepID=A0AA36J295_9DINO|nr:unnamed protein product [Effrenium voratum]